MEKISLIIPVFNEEQNIAPLYQASCEVMEERGGDFEILFVDDGSSDGSGQKLRQIAEQDQRCKLISFRRNFGQTAALMAGIDHSTGDVLVPMDGDGQNDPRDIPLLLDQLEQGFEVCSGWRQDRHDKWLTRVLPSRLANWLISLVSGVRLRDYGCTLKAYRREVIEDVKLYGEMHRFIPVYAHWMGAKVTEIPVRHHARTHGRSNYGLDRVFKVLLDLVLIRFLDSYLTRPIHFFGGFGLINFGLSGACFLWMFYLKLAEGVSFILTPIPILCVFFALIGIISIFIGLLAEIMVRTYHEARNARIYLVRSTVNID